MGSPTIGAGVGERNPGEQGVVQHDHALDQVLQFPDVSGVPMAHEAVDHRRRKGESLAAIELRVPLDEVVRQQGDFGRALAEGWHEHLHHVETVVEIFAEPTFRDRPLQVLVGGGEDADVHAQRRFGADA